MKVKDGPWEVLDASGHFRGVWFGPGYEGFRLGENEILRLPLQHDEDVIREALAAQRGLTGAGLPGYNCVACGKYLGDVGDHNWCEPCYADYEDAMRGDWVAEQINERSFEDQADFDEEPDPSIPF